MNTYTKSPRGGRNIIDLTGQRFGKLIVSRLLDERVDGRRPLWLCYCDCGNTTIVMGETLRGGHRKSCGCLNGIQNRNLSPKEKYINRALREYKRNAGARNIVWNLTDEHAAWLMNGNCHYCGCSPSKHRYGVSLNGIDRKDASGIYDIDNCVSCCTLCNRIKRDLDYTDFLTHIAKIYSRLC